MTAAADDWGLLQRYAHQRDERAFDDLARRYVDLVYSAAVRRVGNHHLAEEITQAVFVILAKKAGSIRPGPPLAGWLLTTVRCVARNAMKMEIRRRRRHEQSAQALAASGGGACSSDPSDVLIWQEVASVIDDAVLRLPSADRRAILLRFFEGRSVGDVAAGLKVSEGAAKKRLGRAIDKLRRRLERKGAGVASVDAAAFAALLSKHVLLHAPGGLVGGICATAAGGAATGAGVALAKGAIRMMAWAKVKLAAVVVAGIALAGGASVALSQRQHVQGPTSQAATAAMSATKPVDPAELALLQKLAQMRAATIQAVPSGRGTAILQTHGQMRAANIHVGPSGGVTAITKAQGMSNRSIPPHEVQFAFSGDGALAKGGVAVTPTANATAVLVKNGQRICYWAGSSRASETPRFN